MSGDPILDSEGNEFIVGAITRMFHFTSGYKGRKEYMYKQVVGINLESRRVGFSHLPIGEGKEPKLSFTSSDLEVAKHHIIIQAYYKDNRSLKRSKRLRD